jgi:hypothetical protein
MSQCPPLEIIVERRAFLYMRQPGDVRCTDIDIINRIESIIRYDQLSELILWGIFREKTLQRAWPRPFQQFMPQYQTDLPFRLTGGHTFVTRWNTGNY